MTFAQILEEILNNSDSDIDDAQSTYSESESVKSDMTAAVETKVKMMLMMEEWTTTSGFLVMMVTIIERNYTLAMDLFYTKIHRNSLWGQSLSNFKCIKLTPDY